MNTQMNNFGGSWTENKIDILTEYAKAYLVIMNHYASRHNWKLLFFDGFAGSGLIINKLKDESGDNLLLISEEDVNEVIIGGAKRILELEEPRSFDEYYFVEKDDKKLKNLEANTRDVFPEKSIHLKNSDCNEELLKMSRFLKSDKGKKFKVLAYIDPCGMQLSWNSLDALKDVSIDIWILIPTGMGVNRLLTTSGEISDPWLDRLESFLGMKREDIISYFYEQNTVPTLFGGEEEIVIKKEKAIVKSAELYSKRLKDLFSYVSNPYVLRTKSNTVLYHFLMVSNNKQAVKVANDIVKKYRLS